ncbi:hypothetical protein [Streptomyces sp. MST-110588]|uniref:hypothetical protein n=1 Tax=Streptomyces sp. MST-110588 TaxID=2833628 RepID=UPI001F5DB37C|nr:hypothetical protein [Streptomyces sp. MST-110588]UNO39426.1 hypothetical protein KGS77_07170 [Streptomyces sp. MST-110588]
MTQLLFSDHRLVQTAVVGSAHSDHPVILPMDAAELDAWRRRHPDYTYWCGYELGGCGGKLTDRLYHDKVCHFAHVAGGPTCGRAATGESSADHLFIKRGLRNLLGQHGQRGTVETRDLGSGPGGAVDLHLPAANRRLRFQLSQLDYRGWRTANQALGDDVDEVDWLFGTDGPLTKEILARHGYSLRFRLETAGGERRVHVGAQTLAEPTVRWSSLEDCRITPTGLLTPATEAIRISPPRPKPLAFPVSGTLHFAFDPKAPVPSDSPFATEGRRLVVADVKPMDSPIVRTVLSLPDDTALPPARYVYGTDSHDHPRLLVHEGGGWAVQLDRFYRLNAHDAARTGLSVTVPELRSAEPAAGSRKPGKLVHSVPKVRAVADPRETRRSRKERLAKPEQAKAVAAPPKSPPEPPPLTRPEAVWRTRVLLTEAAAKRGTAAWSEIGVTAGPVLEGLPQSEITDFLVELETPLTATKPVLSALLTEHDSPFLSCLPAVLAKLGVEHATGVSLHDPQLTEWVTVERQRAYAVFAEPKALIPPRAELCAPQAPAVSPTAEELAALRQEIAEFVEQLEELKPSLYTGSAISKRVGDAMRRARGWLQFHDLSESEKEALSNNQRSRASANPKHLRRTLEEVWVEAAKQAAVRTEPGEELRQLLITVARRAATITRSELEGLRSVQDGVQEWVLVEVDRKASEDAPFLSALVTDSRGFPLASFRDALRAAGYRVPANKHALRSAWRREQDRAHAAYADPPRPLPARLVQRKTAPQPSA